MYHHFRLYALSLLLFLTSCGNRDTTPATRLNIEVARAKTVLLPEREEFIAAIAANYSATIQPRIAGFLASSSFENGMPVKRGQLLFTIDDAPQRAMRMAAEASLSKAEAERVEARRNYERAVPLAQINAISQMQLDQYTADYKASEASVKSAQQTLRNAILEESYTRIYAPISGIISSSAAHIGDYVGPATQFSTLTTIQNIDTVAVDLAIPMSEYLASTGGKGLAYDNSTLLSDIRLKLADGRLYPEEGFYKFTRQSVASAMGSIVLVVGFRNPAYELKAGQFARVTVCIGEKRERVVVPQNAVSQLQDISAVWVIRPDSTAEYRKVEVGATYDTYWIIDKGVAPNEVVATTGLQKLRNGMKVVATESVNN